MNEISQKSVFKVFVLIILMFITLFIINTVSSSLTEISRDNITRNIVGSESADCLEEMKENYKVAKKEQIENDPSLKEEERIIDRTNIITFIVQFLALYLFAYIIVHIINNEKSNKAVK